jgi:hypothetical protein
MVGMDIRSYDGFMSSVGRITAVACSLVLLSGCSLGSTDSAEGLELAESACQLQVQTSSSAFDPQEISVSDLVLLDEVATQKTVLAEQAAELDDRWVILSEASAAISVFASRLLEVRLDDAKVDEAISPEMWEQYKTASNAFLAECSSALKLARGPSSGSQ